MFGYVRIYKDDLKVRDYNIFRTYYCGLCRTLGKNCSQCSRFGLSYDMVFLGIILSSLSPENEKLVDMPCIAHPLKKRKSVTQSAALDYAAHMSVILGYLKLWDDWKDDKSIKALIGMAVYLRPFRRSCRLYEKKYKDLKMYMDKLDGYERDNCHETDIVADCFGKLLEVIFTPDFASESSRALAWLGYNIGRWIYIIDAYADMEEDYKSKSYNPLLDNINSNEELAIRKSKLPEELGFTLTFTLENAASAYELLKIYKNDDILRNILYAGLKIRQDSVLCSVEERNGK